MTPGERSSVRDDILRTDGLRTVLRGAGIREGELESML